MAGTWLTVHRPLQFAHEWCFLVRPWQFREAQGVSNRFRGTQKLIQKITFLYFAELYCIIICNSWYTSGSMVRMSRRNNGFIRVCGDSGMIRAGHEGPVHSESLMKMHFDIVFVSYQT